MNTFYVDLGSFIMEAESQDEAEAAVQKHLASGKLKPEIVNVEPVEMPTPDDVYNLEGDIKK